MWARRCFELCNPPTPFLDVRMDDGKRKGEYVLLEDAADR